MKTTIEINGYEVVIEETEGVLTVKAQKDEETIEEFEIDTTEEGEGEGVQAFGEDEEDEEDFEDGEDFEDEDGEDFGDEDFEDEDGEEPVQDEEETKLESFNSFIKKRK